MDTIKGPLVLASAHSVASAFSACPPAALVQLLELTRKHQETVLGRPVINLTDLSGNVIEIDVR